MQSVLPAIKRNALHIMNTDLNTLSALDLTHCQPVCKIEDLDPILVERLIYLQRLIGFPLRISSGFRTFEYEKSKGRSGSSSHVKHIAVDILVKDSHERYKILLGCLYVDFPRIGIGKNFIHLDIDLKKAHPVIWHYYE